MNTLTYKNYSSEIFISNTFKQISKFFVPAENFFRRIVIIRALKKLLKINSKIDVLKLKTEQDVNTLLEDLTFFEKKLQTLKTGITKIDTLISQNIEIYEHKILQLEIQADCFEPDIEYTEEEEKLLLESLKQTDDDIKNGEFEELILSDFLADV